MATKRMIVGISGASGFQYGVKALELLRTLDVEVHLVVSKGAEKTCQLETDYHLDDVFAMADVVHPIGNLGAAYLQRLVQNGGDAGCALLDANPGCHRPLPDRQSADARRGCSAQRAPPSGAAGAGNAAQPRPYPQYGERDGNGRDYFPAGTRAVSAPANG